MSRKEIEPTALKVIITSLNFRSITRRALSPDDTKIVILDTYGIISLWNSCGEVLDERLAEGIGMVRSIGFNEDSTKVLITTHNGSKTYDIINPQAVRVIEKSLGYSLITKKCLSPDGIKIAILDNYGVISLWEASSGKCFDKCIAKNKEQTESIGFDDTSNKVVVITKNGTELYDIINPSALRAIESRTYYASLIKKNLSPDGTKIVTLDSNGIISLWHAFSGKVIDRFVAQNKESADSIGFNNTGSKIIITNSGSTEQYDIVNPEVLRTIEDSLGSSVITKKKLNLDGTKLLILATNGTVSLWDALTGKPLVLTLARDKECAKSIGFNDMNTTVIITMPTGPEELSLL